MCNNYIDLFSICSSLLFCKDLCSFRNLDLRDTKIYSLKIMLNVQQNRIRLSEKIVLDYRIV